jgi:NitT/TauT family transport system ATP-binding protein
VQRELVLLSRVSFRYETRVPVNRDVLTGLDLSIREGEFMCLLGPSGCGKTTVLNLLAGFERLSEGQIAIGGQPLRGPGAERCVVFQGDASLFHWLTARENVEFGLKVVGTAKPEREQRAREYLELVGLTGQEGKYPAELSGGMKQRVNLARALAGPARILLMDEPFGQLDAQTRTLLQDELVEIWRKTGRTIFFVTHDIAEAVTLADRIVVMRRGPGSSVKEIVECGLARPRDRGSPDFGRLYNRIGRSIAEEVSGRRGGQ